MNDMSRCSGQMSRALPREASFVPNLPRRRENPAFLREKIARMGPLEQRYGGQNPLKGTQAGPDAIRLHTNDYLCLAGDSRIIEAEIEALRRTGHGDSVSRVWSHHLPTALRDFEERAATLAGSEDAIVCPSGYAANVGLIQAIAGPETPVYIDMMAHQSLWEGITSAGAAARPFGHNNPRHLAQSIEREGPGLVLIDAVYSTTGTRGHLEAFVEICERTGCALLVDETHSFGTYGPDGSGMVRELGLEDRVHFRTAGLSKAVAGRGGLIFCARNVAEYVRYHANPLVFSTTVLPHEIAGYNAALDIFRDEPWRRDRLHANHKYLREGLAALGYNIEASDTQILSLVPGEPLLIVALRDALERNGIFGAVFLPPATGERRCLIRLSVHCGLTQDDLDRILRVCGEIRGEVRMRDWRSTGRQRDDRA